MRILLTGANGYIGMRLLTVLVQEGHDVICCVRNKNRFHPGKNLLEHIKVLEVDFAQPVSGMALNEKFDAAYYLIHSMTATTKNFEDKETATARHFADFMSVANPKQIVYLGGIANDKLLSKHLSSRKHVEETLKTSGIPVTVLRAAIIVGSGSASFEIIRDLVEKLPIMLGPEWLNTKTQPIAIRNMMEILAGVLLNEKTFDQTFDVGGPEVLSYRDMLAQYAKVRKLKRRIFTTKIINPKISSHWLNLITSVNLNLAKNLVESMHVTTVASNNDLAAAICSQLFSYEEAIEMAFTKIEQNMVVSSWKDSFHGQDQVLELDKYIQVPTFGCFHDDRSIAITNDLEQVKENFLSIGGNRGWYYWDFLWKVRGLFDKMVGGVGLRRGRTHDSELEVGDAVDFWRVILSNKKEGRLLLFAEMKLPGEAWLEFKVEDKKGQKMLRQTATFRPKGISGRLYWYSVLPFHFFIFAGMLRNIEGYNKSKTSIKPKKVLDKAR